MELLLVCVIHVKVSSGRGGKREGGGCGGGGRRGDPKISAQGNVGGKIDHGKLCAIEILDVCKLQSPFPFPSLSLSLSIFLALSLSLSPYFLLFSSFTAAAAAANTRPPPDEEET